MGYCPRDRSQAGHSLVGNFLRLCSILVPALFVGRTEAATKEHTWVGPTAPSPYLTDMQLGLYTGPLTTAGALSLTVDCVGSHTTIWAASSGLTGKGYAYSVLMY